MSVHAEFNGRNWAAEIIENGGATLAFTTHRGEYRLSEHKMRDGYFVSAYARSATEKMIPVEEFTNYDIGFFIGSYFAELVQPNFYLGAWVFEGYVYLDISEWIADKDDAIFAADFRDQIAIWDIAANEAINL